MRDGFLPGFIIGGGMDHRPVARPATVDHDWETMEENETLRRQNKALEDQIKWLKACFYGRGKVASALKSALTEVAPESPLASSEAAQKILNDAFEMAIKDPSIVKTPFDK